MTAAWLLVGGVLLLSSGRTPSGRHTGVAVPGPGRHRTAILRGAAGVAAAVVAVASIGGPVGVAVGATVGVTAWLVFPNLAGRDRPPAVETARVPLVLDLVATVLRTGQPVAAALDWGADAAGPRLAEELRRTAALLRLGASPADAWSKISADARLRAVAVVAIRSADSGIRLAAAWTALASELRADAVAAATARAGRTGVWVMAPLGLCFLPAFVCLGIAPVIAGVAGGLLDGGLG